MTDFETLEKYEKALEIIAERIQPKVLIQNGQYYLTTPGIDMLNFVCVLSPKEGKLLFELFGGTDYDRK